MQKLVQVHAHSLCLKSRDERSTRVLEKAELSEESKEMKTKLYCVEMFLELLLGPNCVVVKDAHVY